MVVDAVHLLTGVPVEEIEVRLGEVNLGDPQVLAAAREARERVAAAARSQEDAARASRRVVTQLRYQCRNGCRMCGNARLAATTMQGPRQIAAG